MKLLKSLYLTPRLFIVAGALVVLFTVSYIWSPLFPIVQALLFAAILALLVDIALLYRWKDGVFARREATDKLSNGDDNPVDVYVENFYGFPLHASVIDELPFQFQIRDFSTALTVPSGATRAFRYKLHPVERGEYYFGALNVYAHTPLGLAARRYRFEQNRMLPVYPSFLQMRAYELYAISNRLTEYGIKKIRRIGHTMEFDQIREYVMGDDMRTINWKATARHNGLMVNQYQDERSQQVYCLVDMGRVMKMPFEGMSLLDYAINASLVLSNIALRKQDKAGLVTFADTMGSVVPADKKGGHITKILEVLYNQQTRYLESSYELLFTTITRRITQRSLLLLFTNFETLSSLERQLPYMRALARQHLLVVIFFENTELRKLLDEPAVTAEEITIKTIAEKFAYEKRLIVKELEKYGIHAILTAPQNLTVNTINKYLELKARGLI